MEHFPLINHRELLDNEIAHALRRALDANRPLSSDVVLQLVEDVVSVVREYRYFMPNRFKLQMLSGGHGEVRHLLHLQAEGGGYHAESRILYIWSLNLICDEEVHRLRHLDCVAGVLYPIDYEREDVRENIWNSRVKIVQHLYYLINLKTKLRALLRVHLLYVCVELYLLPVNEQLYQLLV